MAKYKRVAQIVAVAAILLLMLAFVILAIVKGIAEAILIALSIVTIAGAVFLVLCACAAAWLSIEEHWEDWFSE